MKNAYGDELMNHSDMDKGVLDFLTLEKPKFIFGAGKQAENCLHIFGLVDVMIEGVLVTKKQFDFISDIPVYEYMNFKDKKDIAVLVSVSEQISNSIKVMLTEVGYDTIYCCENWEKTNGAVKEVFFCKYLKDKEIDLKRKYINLKGCYFINPLKQGNEYRQLMYGTAFSDIIIPMAFGDDRYISAGAYEDEDFKISNNDIVVDVGANIGAFSVLAALKAKKVYAVEASPTAIPYLKMNTEYLENIEIMESAISDHIGMVEFYDRIDYCKYSSMAETSGNGYVVKKVNCSTLDRIFIGIPNPLTFIKINVNGDEEKVLIGAEQIIKRYHPRIVVALEMCKDYEKIIRLVKSFNVKYCFYQKKGRLYFGT